MKATTRRTTRPAAAWAFAVVLTGLLVLCVPQFEAQTASPPVDPGAILNAIVAKSTLPVAPKTVQVAKAPPAAPRNEYSVQITGLFLANPTGPMAPSLAHGSIGMSFGMRTYLNNWEALDAELAYTRDGSGFYSPKTAGGTPTATTQIPASLLRLSLSEVLTTNATDHVQPYLSIGGGVGQFQPLPGAGAGYHSQVRPMGILGLGANVRVVHLGFRFGVEAFFYKTPDFHDPQLVTGWVHTVQPSAGLIFSF